MNQIASNLIVLIDFKCNIFFKFDYFAVRRTSIHIISEYKILHENYFLEGLQQVLRLILDIY